MLMLIALLLVFTETFTQSNRLFSSIRSRELWNEANEAKETVITAQQALPTISYYNTTGDPIARYVGASKNQHEEAIVYLTGLGYRIKSISIYGKPNKPYKAVYAVVWVKRTGPV